MVHCSVPNATSHNATSHLLIEIYRWPSSPASTSTSISSIFDYLFSPRRLLVVRPAPSLAPPSCPATPLLRVAAPHALTLLEIAHILEHAAFTGQHDLTRNKALNISLIGRSLPDSPPSPLSPADHLVHCAHTTSSPDQLPPYQPCIGGLPPAYSPHPLPPLFI
ncbi:hypothetical protein EV174_001393 [Coemansia sp. RSA 2320]|nr:hypothetical protein EV174_001393 [Coemansia sp. RSA 2320]